MPCQAELKETPLTPDQSRLAESCHLLAIKLGNERARACGARGDEADTLVSASLLGLVLAARSFKPELGYKFTTWAQACCKQAIYLERRRQAIHRKRWLQEQIDPRFDDGELSLIVDPRSGRDEETAQARDQFADRLAELQRKRPREAEAVIRHANGETLAEIGASWGVTRQRAQQARDAGLKALRKA